jgi:hypothetical protein
LDGFNKFRILFGRVGVIKTEVGVTIQIPGNFKVGDDGPGMADVQIGIRFRRKPGDDLFHFAGFHFLHYYCLDKIFNHMSFLTYNF